MAKQHSVRNIALSPDSRSALRDFIGLEGLISRIETLNEAIDALWRSRDLFRNNSTGSVLENLILRHLPSSEHSTALTGMNQLRQRHLGDQLNASALNNQQSNGHPSSIHQIYLDKRDDIRDLVRDRVVKERGYVLQVLQKAERQNGDQIATELINALVKIRQKRLSEEIPNMLNVQN